METIVISLGGSLIIPEDVATGVDFLKGFRELILAEIKKGKKFIIITGGGKICRKYNEVAQKVKNISKEDLDWIGIYSTRFNAEFIRVLFGDVADQKIILDPITPIRLTKLIVTGGGWEPGNSTDLVAVLAAKNIGARKIINLSNIDYVYDSNPNSNPNAKKIEKISWTEYRKLIPSEWVPGMNSPFDPVASKVAEAEGIEVAIMNGKLIANLANYLKGESFLGTVIK